jgi:hypothetical protein
MKRLISKHLYEGAMMDVYHYFDDDIDTISGHLYNTVDSWRNDDIKEVKRDLDNIIREIKTLKKKL